ncbi:unnamed protein product [Urochloa decumbens]|uniref:Uncharacterized protein n=1 Tax=Urochloa decumbens TaxID=240449 RepID=A0ABC9DL69_9POAL
MARVVIAAALVLCAAIAMADAARDIEYQPADAGFVGGEGPAPQLEAEAVSPSGHVDVEPAVSGGGLDGDGGNVIADILWFVLRWANEAPAGDSRRKDY